MASSASSPHRAGSVLEALYAAGSGELRWDAALGEMAADFGADIVAVFADRPASRQPFVCLSNAEPEVEDVFASWSAVARHQDPVRAALDRLPPRSIVRSSDLLSPGAYRASGFYRDYARRFGGMSFMDVDLERSPGSVLNLCLWAQDRPIAFDEDAVAALKSLLPHVARALRLDGMLQRAGLRHDFALAALEVIATPVFAVDARGVVTFGNPAANEFTAAENGLEVRRGVLDATCPQHPSLATRLRRLLAEPHRFAGIHTIAVARADKRPLVLTVLLPPASSDIWKETGALSAGALVFVGDPDQELGDVGRDLQQIHGLTEREARTTVSLANGLDPGMIAREEGVGVETIRKHLKQAFAKTGTSRQAELVRLVLLELGRHRRARER